MWVICVVAISMVCPLLLRSLPICCVRAMDERGQTRQIDSDYSYAIGQIHVSYN